MVGDLKLHQKFWFFQDVWLIRSLIGLAILLLTITGIAKLNRWFLLSEILISFQPFFLIASFVLLLVFILLRQLKMIAVVLFVFGVNLVAVSRFFGIRQLPSVTDSDLTVLLYNVDKNLIPYIGVDHILTLLETEQPSIAVLLEIGEVPAQSLQQKTKTSYPYSYMQHDVEYDGVLILSQLAIVESNTLTLGGGRSTPAVDFLLNDSQIHLIAPHPTNMLYSFAERNSQLTALTKYISDVNKPLIVAGDLNTTPWSQWYLDLEQAGVVNSRLGHGILPTFCTPIPWLKLPLDHLLVSSHFQTIATHTFSELPSDHLPLMSNLKFE